MSRLLVDVDDDALAEASELLATATKRETVNAALLKIAHQHKRLRALDVLVQMGDEGAYDLSLLLDKKTYR